MTTATATPPKLRYTPDEMLALPDEGRGFELIEGELRERLMSTRSSHVGGRVFGTLFTHCDASDAGWLLQSDASFRCFPFDESRVRRADVSFIARDRMTREQYQREGHCSVAPDLVVEVISPHDLSEQVELKVEEWLAAGVRLVWRIHPTARLVHVYHGDGTSYVRREADTLTGDPVLPGLSVPVAALFHTPA